MRLSLNKADGHTPVRPLLPPVKLSHWKVTAQVIWANAKVSMARYTPDKRTANQPNTKAPKAATKGATNNDTSIDKPKARTSSAAP